MIVNWMCWREVLSGSRCAAATPVRAAPRLQTNLIFESSVDRIHEHHIHTSRLIRLSRSTWQTLRRQSTIRGSESCARFRRCRSALWTATNMDAAYEDTSNDLSTIYEKHPLDINTTRVLRILPPNLTDGSDIISCQLSVISLDDSPKYRALSYVWGDPSVTKPTLVDNTLMQVRMNLWTFLDQMRTEQYWVHFGSMLSASTKTT